MRDQDGAIGGMVETPQADEPVDIRVLLEDTGVDTDG
jgi:hypothetical protein